MRLRRLPVMPVRRPTPIPTCRFPFTQERRRVGPPVYVGPPPPAYYYYGYGPYYGPYWRGYYRRW